MPERLTEKHIVDNIDCGYKIKKDTCEDGIVQGWNKTDAINKLGELEDIEDRIKFPLKKAFECLEKGVYKFDWTRNIEHYDIRGIEINGLSAISKLCSYAECDELLKYEDYGKNWALTKEELL